MKLYTKFMMLCAMLFAFAAQAQFTHPMLFEINSPSGVAGSYNYGPQSGAGWGITALPSAAVSGQLVWGFDNAQTGTLLVDSLLCDSVTNSYAGKIVLIRRGTCNFSQKMYNAQLAGAVGCVICNNTGTVDIINMAAGTNGAQVTIPAVSIGFNDCAAIAARVDAGDTVVATFRKPFISEASGFFAVETPQAQIYPHDSIMSVDITNAGTTNATNVIVSLDITEPSGNVVTLTETLAALNADSTRTVTFNSRYSPSDTGIYTQVFKSTLSIDSIEKTFQIGSERFRLDRESDYSWGTITDAGFATANFRMSLGTTYLTGPSGAVSKSVTYAMGDNMAQFLGKQLVIEIRAFPNTLTNATAVIDSFPIVAVGVDTISTADTAAYTLNTITLLDVNTLEDSTVLAANSQYLVLVKYIRPTGDTLSIAPRFAFSGDESFISYGTVVNSDQLYLGGFGGINAVIRLNTNDVLNPVGITPTLITQSQFDLFPNPANNILNMNLSLEETAENATVTMFDINGRIIEQLNYSNVKQQNIQFNVANLSAGFYFVRIQSENGVQTKEFIKN